MAERKKALSNLKEKGYPKSKKGKHKMGKVFGEFKAGALKSGGNGAKVTDPKQAAAIAFSEARKAEKDKD